MARNGNNFAEGSCQSGAAKATVHAQIYIDQSRLMSLEQITKEVHSQALGKHIHGVRELRRLYSEVRGRSLHTPPEVTTPFIYSHGLGNRFVAIH